MLETTLLRRSFRDDADTMLRLATLVFLTLIGFALAHAAPGDPAEILLRGAGSEPREMTCWASCPYSSGV